MHEAKTQLARLVERAGAGEDIVIGRAGRPVARLVRYEQRKEPRRPGRWKDKIRMADDWEETPRSFLDALEAAVEKDEDIDA
jgi:prevent-host-death family protein